MRSKQVRSFIFFFLITAAFVLLPMDYYTNKFSIDLNMDNVFPISETRKNWVEETLSTLTLRERIGQMIVPDAPGYEYSEDSDTFIRLRHYVEDLKVGGIMFLKGKVQSQFDLTKRLQELSDLPLLISADFERGIGMRLDDGTEFPYNMAVAATGDPLLAYKLGKVTATEGKALGVHQNYAPMLDINHNSKNPVVNVRSYSDRTDVILRYAISFINGTHEAGMITTAKHFPGHGATDLDSHKELPLIDVSREFLASNDIVPFKETFRANLQSVMVGHLEVPALEPKRGLPATLSGAIINDYLLTELKFKGLVISDALNMHAITNNYSVEEAGVLAVEAGNDILLFPEDTERTLDAIYEAVLDGKITEERIDRSVAKILSAKSWLGLDKNRIVSLREMKNTVGKKEHARLAFDIAEKSITLLKDDYGLVPIDLTGYKKVACINISDTKIRKNKSSQLRFEEYLKTQHKKVTAYSLGSNSRAVNYQRALKIAKDASIILLPVYVNVKSFSGNISLYDHQLEFIDELVKLKRPIIMLSLGNPYIIANMKNIPAYICSYGNPKLSQIAAADALFGRTKITGKLPVTIPGTGFEFGSGLTRLNTRLGGFTEAADSLYDFQKVDREMEKAVKEKVFPGGVLLIGHKSRIVYNKAFGNHTYENNSRLTSTEDLFDLASVSKVVGTTSAAMLLYDAGKLNLDKPVYQYLPEFNNNGKDKITVKNLLMHNAGFPAFKRYYEFAKNRTEVINDIMNTQLEYTVGAKTVYSDLGIITLQIVIEKITGTSLDVFLKENLFGRLEMKNTMYNPKGKLLERCVPTEIDTYWRNRLIKGTVHDETADMIGGVAGHAGLFSTSSDLAKFAFIMMNGGRNGDLKLFEEATIDLFTTRKSTGTRALGWDTKAIKGSSAGRKFSMNSFGHTGFTGTSIWIDKENEIFAILLTNRVHPTRENRTIIKFRPKLHDVIFDSIIF